LLARQFLLQQDLAAFSEGDEVEGGLAEIDADRANTATWNPAVSSLPRRPRWLLQEAENALLDRSLGIKTMKLQASGRMIPVALWS